MINKVMLVGKVKSDPQSRGSATTFRLGTWKIIHDGRRFDSTHSIEGFGRTGELMSSMREGELISVEGAIKHSSYEKDGRKVWFTSITASSVSRLGEDVEQSIGSAQGQAPSEYPPRSSKPNGSAPSNGAGGEEDYGF
tara:strand:- start:460 stop:873 length:414 start_codon:yes stop_codon:yes gene_type:complete